MNNDISIRKGSVQEVVHLSKQLPEFDNPHEENIYEERMQNKSGLILVATVNGVLAGFKVGYDKFGDGSFYTWMGGVIPEFRRLGLAKKLAHHQEQYAINKGYNSIILKTRNKHRNMRLFAVSSGYDVIKVILMKQIEENRIVLKKVLK